MLGSARPHNHHVFLSPIPPGLIARPPQPDPSNHPGDGSSGRVQTPSSPNPCSRFIGTDRLQGGAANHSDPLVPAFPRHNRNLTATAPVAASDQVLRPHSRRSAAVGCSRCTATSSASRSATAAPGFAGRAAGPAALGVVRRRSAAERPPQVRSARRTRRRCRCRQGGVVDVATVLGANVVGAGTGRRGAGRGCRQGVLGKQPIMAEHQREIPAVGRRWWRRDPDEEVPAPVPRCCCWSARSPSRQDHRRRQHGLVQRPVVQRPDDDHRLREQPLRRQRGEPWWFGRTAGVVVQRPRSSR